MNLRKAGGTAVIGRASGFLGSEACTTRDLAARLDVTLAQTSLRTITSKAGNVTRILTCDRRSVKRRDEALSATGREKYVP